MRIPRLFLESTLDVNTTLTLTESRAHYLKQVLRLKAGDRVTLFNGAGGEYTGIIGTADRHRVDVHIDNSVDTERESSLDTRLGLGITKRDAMDIAIQKVTELGATEITPVLSEFTDIPRKALAARYQHWLQITRAACEQCERNRPPHLNAPMTLGDWLDGIDADTRLVAHPTADSSLGGITGRPRSVALLTGPEGGFSEAEIDLCVAANFRATGLGPRILRADTAPVVLLTLVQARFGDLVRISPQ